MQPTESPFLPVTITTISFFAFLTFLPTSQGVSDRSAGVDVSVYISVVFQQVKLLSTPDHKRLTLTFWTLVERNPNEPMGSITFNSLQLDKLKYGIDGLECNATHS